MSGLPSGYKQLEYIESTGTQYIDTGVRVMPENYQQLKMSVTCEKIGKGSGASDWLLDGSNIANAYFYMGVYNGKYYYGCGTADHYTGIAAASGKQTFTLDIPSSKFTVSDTVDVSISTEPVTASASLHLFGYNNNPVRCYAEKIYSCQIYTGATLVRDFVPCKNASGVIGLYDTVGRQFYANAGTGSFTAGPEIIPDPPAAPAGLQTVLAVALQWAASESADRYDVYRDGAKLGSTETTKYVDTTAEPNETYVYTVKAVNGGGESAGTSITVYTKSGYFEYKPLIESANFP